MTEETHYVYIIGEIRGDKIAGPVKVGISQTPFGRLSTIQTGNPRKLAVACAFAIPSRDIARTLERAFHYVKSDLRLEGEWFDMSIIDAVSAMCGNIRAMLNSFEIGGHDVALILEMTGVLAAEQKLERDEQLQ
jgi:hypothetical protein